MSWKRDTIDGDVAAKGLVKTDRIDLGLALLGALVRPGHDLTRYDIAAWCGCTDAAIFLIERRAMRKVANRLKFGRARPLGREIAKVKIA